MPTMRSVPLGREPGEAEIASFADLIDRPLLIVGNGPSSAMPPYHRIPADVVVFRMNWFFLESNYHFGRRVDGYFSAIPNEKMETLLQDEIRAKRYEVDRILSPMRHAALRDGDQYSLEPMGDGVEELDSWSIPSRHPRLARAFMSRPGLPTTGLQALAFGLGVGFREVYLAGIDLYEAKDSRYGYTVTQAAESALKDKDLTPGYESAHGLDTDLAFLRSCLAEFPDATVRSVSQSDTLHLFVPQAEDLTDRPHLEPGTPDAVAASKDTVDLELPEVGERTTGVVPKVDAPLWKEIDGRKCAFVTVVSGAYHHGARALANSLREVSDVPLIALVTPDADRLALASSGITTIEIPGIRNPMNSGGNKIQSRFAATYTKLHVFRLDFLDRVAYLDSDTVIFQNVDDLFDGDDFAAVPDAGLDQPDGQIFNSGVFAVTPDHGMFERMMPQLRRTTSYDGGDQGFLNEFFDGWRKLGIEYNTTKRMYSHHPQTFHEEDVKVLHYVGRKPWEPTAKGERYEQLDYAWLRHLRDWEKDELIRDLRHEVAGGKPPEAGSLSPFRQAQRFNRTNQAGEAIHVLEDVLEKREPTPAECRELAIAYRRLGRHSDAARILTRAYRMQPSKSLVRDIVLARARSYSRKIRGDSQ
ncbi:glycosyltransferase [Myceligenerans indicum]|uniref:Glycosyl transferase n=1 Tax=Myceligenerans indicum TaxID=2593663 RepID=A0ABS1LIA8_9MICO|nr:glycosyltransferase [Myceligenerans indicum]MBL0885868.1 hypothetical protein [Myceligenerans indicum]